MLAEAVVSIIAALVVTGIFIIITVPLYFLSFSDYYCKIRYLGITGQARTENLVIKACSYQRAYKKVRKYAELGCRGYEFIDNICLH